MKNLKFATCINCIDGRAQVPAIKLLKRRFAIDYVDMVTEPGPDKILAQNKNKRIIASIKRRVKISVIKHRSKIIIIAGHYDCAGNPCEEKEHLQQIRKAMENMKKWNLNVEIYGIWVDKDLKASLIQ